MLEARDAKSTFQPACPTARASQWGFGHRETRHGAVLTSDSTNGIRGALTPTLGARKLLDTFVVAFDDEDVPAPIHSDANGTGELPIPAARAAPLGDEGPGFRNFWVAFVAKAADKAPPPPTHGDPKG